jgi:acetylornithine aminotransferase
MALRISAKRVAATFKARNASMAENVVFKRHASQATAAAPNLAEGTQADSLVRSAFQLRSSHY